MITLNPLPNTQYYDLPNLRAAASPRTTAIGCFRQNSWSCGLKACFLFSRWTDGVGGWSCSAVSRCGGQSGGQGGGASAARIEQGGGGSLWPIALQKKKQYYYNLCKQYFKNIIKINTSVSWIDLCQGFCSVERKFKKHHVDNIYLGCEIIFNKKILTWQSR